MQKKIIALAVAGLASSAAFAQTNVTVYGTIDMAYVHQSDSVDDANAQNNIDDGGWDRSRFGLKGTEDLGNGLSASFQQEFGLKADNQNGATLQRQSFVSLAGKGWGSIKAGGFWNIVDDVVSGTSAGGGSQVNWGEGVIDLSLNTFASNAVQFDSLDYSGFKFAVGYSSNFTSADDSVSGDNLRTWFGGASYTNGALFVGATYTHGSKASDDVNYDEWLLGAAYDFGVAKVGLAYADASLDSDVDFTTSALVSIGTNELDRRTWRANVSVPITAKDTVTLSYTDSKLELHDGLSNYDASAWGIAYMHALSKRTNLYASAYVADANHGFLVLNTDGTNSYDGFETGFKVGVRHQF